MEGSKCNEDNMTVENLRLDNLLLNIFKAEAEIANAEASIIGKVDIMLDTVTNLMQMINPVEEQYSTTNDNNNSDSIKLNLVKERVINEHVIENLNKMADSLTKVLRGLGDLIGESLDSLGDCKEARGKLLESLSHVLDRK